MINCLYMTFRVSFGLRLSQIAGSDADPKIYEIASSRRVLVLAPRRRTFSSHRAACIGWRRERVFVVQVAPRTLVAPRAVALVVFLEKVNDV
jgi:hypothetical protein